MDKVFILERWNGFFLQVFPTLQSVQEVLRDYQIVQSDKHLWTVFNGVPVMRVRCAEVQDGIGSRLEEFL